MAPFRPWAGLPPDLLLFISGGFGLLPECYSSIRGVCTSWRTALLPPVPSIITVAVSAAAAPLCANVEQVSALFLPPESSFSPFNLPRAGKCVGSSDGWLAVTSYWPGIFLLNPLAGGKQVPLLPLRNDGKPVPKIVFAPNPKPDDYTAVAICDSRKLAYTKTRDMKWMIIDVTVEEMDQLTDLAYDVDGSRVYCVTMYGDVHVLHIPHGRRQRPIVEPLHAKGFGLPFDPATAFAPPYSTVYKFTSAKNIFFFDGSLYQVWRNTTTATVSLQIPGGGRFRMAKDAVFVLKHSPGCRPRWDAVNNLGGCLVFLGKNQPVVLRADGIPGVRANCVYWIDPRSRCEPVVFDMATRTSSLHHSAAWISAMTFDLLPSLRPREKHWNICVRVSRMWEYRVEPMWDPYLTLIWS
ncbi:hypothetical protein ACP4OV_022192 [Aristida adscensionis]